MRPNRFHGPSRCSNPPARSSNRDLSPAAAGIEAKMKIAAVAPLLLLSASLGGLVSSLPGCASSHESAPLEAPNVHFQKALVMAEAPLEKRREIERMVADEMQRRRPHVQVVLSSDQFPDIEHVSRENFLAYLQNYEID